MSTVAENPNQTIDTARQAREKSTAKGEKRAVLYRMATDDHLCPFGLKSKSLLKRKGYAVEDNLLTNREQQDSFKAEHDVETTPQTFINSERVGGYDDLRRFFGKTVRADLEKSLCTDPGNLLLHGIDGRCDCLEFL